MNASAFSDLLGKLPDDMLADAFPNARRFQQAADETADHPKKANVLQKNTKPVTSSIFAPRWTIAAALAACLLFAVGFGALMLHGKQNDLIPQNSQVDSLLEEVTAATTSAQTTTAKPVTVTTLRTEPADTTTRKVVTEQSVTKVTLSEAASSVADNQTSVRSTSSAKAVISSETSTTAAMTAVTTKAVPSVDPNQLSAKAEEKVKQQIRSGETLIPVHLTYYEHTAGLSDQAKEAGRKYAETLDPNLYSEEEISLMEWDYYMETQEKLYRTAKEEQISAILSAIGADPENAICFPYYPRIFCILTPEQILLADKNENVRSIVLGYAWKDPEGFTIPDDEITDPDTVRAMYTALFEENDLDARCAENITVPNGQIQLVIEWNTKADIPCSFIIQDFAAKYHIDRYAYKIVALTDGKRNEASDV